MSNPETSNPLTGPYERMRVIATFAVLAVVLLGAFVDLSGERQWQVALIGAVIGGAFAHE